MGNGSTALTYTVEFVSEVHTPGNQFIRINIRINGLDEHIDLAQDSVSDIPRELERILNKLGERRKKCSTIET